MNNRVLTVGSILAVVVSLLMISSATATQILQNTSAEPFAQKVAIDSNIKITKKHLPLLKKSLAQLTDTNVKCLVTKIISTVEQNGYAESNDICEIVEKLSLPIQGINTGLLSSSGYGITFSFPGFLLEALPFFYIGPAIVAHWDGDVFSGCWPSYVPVTKINFIQRYTGDHSGYLIGFVGMCSNGFVPPGNHLGYQIYGACLLLIVV